LSPQHLVMPRLEIEHIIPVAKGGSNAEVNLWLACPICNRYKSDKTTAMDPETGATVPLFNPRTQTWSDHFFWSDDGLHIIGRTAMGRATVAALHLSDDPDVLEVRSYWVLAGSRHGPAALGHSGPAGHWTVSYLIIHRKMGAAAVFPQRAWSTV
jgi:HNH endonuclease